MSASGSSPTRASIRAWAALPSASCGASARSTQGSSPTVKRWMAASSGSPFDQRVLSATGHLLEVATDKPLVEGHAGLQLHEGEVLIGPVRAQRVARAHLHRGHVAQEG